MARRTRAVLMLSAILSLSAAGCGSHSTGAAKTPAAGRTSSTSSTSTPTSTSATATVPSSPATGGGTSVGGTNTAFHSGGATTSAPVATTPAPSGGSTLTATGADNGHTLTMNPGQRLRVQLDSTYWNFEGSSNQAVLRGDGETTVRPEPSGCVPGAGCGTATAYFIAVTAGRATVTASRSSCGEALACTGSNGHWSVTVLVR